MLYITKIGRVFSSQKGLLKFMKKKNFCIEQITWNETCEHTLSSGKFYQIILIEHGACDVQLEDSFFYCNTETAIFLKPNENVLLRYPHSKYGLKLLSIYILPEYLHELSDQTCNFEKSFSFLPVSKTMIHLDTRDTTLIKNLAKSIIASSHSEDAFGSQLYEKSMLSIFLIVFLRSCMHSDPMAPSRNRKTLVMDDIFRYIREHLTEDLSLETLEKQFFVSRYHLCREFKKMTGQTIHSYIIKSRLDLCKKYIETGMSIKEVHTLCGFHGYNHLFHAFRKEYGMTPKEYYEKNCRKL